MTEPREHLPRLIAWEVTRSCMLACKHCRAAARTEPYEDELSTDECFALLDNIAAVTRPIIILTGGEPMLREDIYDIAAHADRLHLPVVMAPCGMLIDDASAAKILASGIRRISISIDGATADSHDAFRGIPGAFDGAMRGIEAAKRAGVDFQINTTITAGNRRELPGILDLAVRLGASVFNPFLLVPTGRGRQLADQELTPAEYEQTLEWLAGQQGRRDIRIRVTCAPHYQRILRQRHVPVGPREVKGCMGGHSFAFISHIGKVQACGFLDIDCGDLREAGLDFWKIWRTSEVFLRLRDPSAYKGRCGVCEFGRVCGGCRARAYAVTGDYLAEEPFCTYQPRAVAEIDDADKSLLSAIQADFPVRQGPFEAVAQRCGISHDEVIERVVRLRSSGLIRRIGAVFDSRSLGYASTLVAAQVPAEGLEDVAATVSELPGVTHNYSRRHAYNLWFTLTAQSDQAIDAALEELKRRTGIDDFHSLPALAVYKIRVHFDLNGQAPPPQTSPSGPTQPLDEQQKQLVRLLQDDLPATAEPYDEIARQLGWPVERVLEQVRQWLDAGVIRRMGGIVRHRRLGFAANGMAVFDVPADRIDQAGRCLAGRAEVSHCYRRPALPDFPYTLYAMTHGRTADQVTAAVARMAEQIRADRFDVLFSQREFKKVSMRYFMEDQPG